MKLPSRYTLQFRSPVAPLAGAWIEIPEIKHHRNVIVSLPSRERGLKYCDKCEGCTWRGVAPLAGAWIEINVFSPDATSSKSLPSRERGLKLLRTAYHSSAVPVAPLAGAWIEIRLTMWARSALMVAPLAGAWIEIVSRALPGGHAPSLPSRERGLKFKFVFKFIHAARRSPRGSVD